MRIEANLIRKEQQGQKKGGGGVLCDSSSSLEKKGKKNRRRQKQKQQQRKVSAMQNNNAVQKLFEACKEVFKGAGTVPVDSGVQRIRSVLDSMKPEDLGLNEGMPYFKTCEAKRGAPPVTYLHLYDCENFSICIFCLPPSSVIPLHNHPGMTVFSKLLFGSMHIKSYDWDTGAANTSPSDCKGSTSSRFRVLKSKSGNTAVVRLAKVSCNAVYTSPCNTSILYPASGGNMHRFTARTACAVLDVLGPPYSTDESDPKGRHCTYYHDFPYPSFSGDAISGGDDEGEGHAWLEETEKPRDFIVDGDEYKGPKIVES